MSTRPHGLDPFTGQSAQEVVGDTGQVVGMTEHALFDHLQSRTILQLLHQNS